jgi:transposase
LLELNKKLVIAQYRGLPLAAWHPKPYPTDLTDQEWALIGPSVPGSPGFLLLAKHWIVERTFAWLGRDRRLAKDYQYVTQTGETMIRVAMIHFIARCLARLTPF